MSQTFTVDAVVHSDGIMTVTCEEIWGLVLEVENLRGLTRELLTLAPLLLQSNHGLSEADASSARYRVRFMSLDDAPQVQRRASAAARAASTGMVYV